MNRALSRRIAFAGGLVVFGSLALLRPTGGRKARIASPQLVQTAVATQDVALSSAEPLAIDTEPRSSAVDASPTMPDPPASPERARAAIVALGKALRSPGFDEHTWQTRVRAVADSLGLEAAAHVRTLLNEPLEGDELLAGTSLLMALQVKGEVVLAPLPQGLTTALANTAEGHREDPRGSKLAARALAALGGPRPSALLLREAALQIPTDERRRALDALRESTDAWVALELAASLRKGDEDPLERLVQITLEKIGRHSAWAFAPYERALVVDAMLANGGGRNSGLDDRGLERLLRAWDPTHALNRFENAGHEPSLALQLTSSKDVLEIESILARAGERTDMPDWIGRVPNPTALSPGLRSGLANHLGRRIEEGEQPATRRRAVAGLAHLEDPYAVPILEQTLRFDPDASVRNAAVLALARIAPDHPELAKAIASDPSPAVRRTARFVSGQ